MRASAAVKLIEIRRYPVKSMLGELLTHADVGARGLVGDRLWAVRDGDGKLGSGKNTRRFRRMTGLMAIRATTVGDIPVIEFADGRRFSADDPAADAAVTQALGRVVTLAPEKDVPHHDEGPVSIVTTGALRALSKVVGTPVEALRFRANLLVDTAET